MPLNTQTRADFLTWLATATAAEIELLILDIRDELASRETEIVPLLAGLGIPLEEDPNGDLVLCSCRRKAPVG